MMYVHQYMCSVCSLLVVLLEYFIILPYSCTCIRWNYWQVNYLAIRSGNAIGDISIDGFEYCMERSHMHAILQPKWRAFILAIFM